VQCNKNAFNQDWQAKKKAYRPSFQRLIDLRNLNEQRVLSASGGARQGGNSRESAVYTQVLEHFSAVSNAVSVPPEAFKTCC